MYLNIYHNSDEDVIEFDSNKAIKFNTEFLELDVVNDIPDESIPIGYTNVKVNEDNSITMITENNFSNQIYNEEKDEKVIYKSSNLETAVNEIYTTLFSDVSLDNMVLTKAYCNDTQNLTITSSSASNRLNITNPIPTFNCIEEDKIYSKAGLITADEMVYAGALYNNAVNNNTTYLDNNKNFWTMTSFSEDKISVWDSTAKKMIEEDPITNYKEAPRIVITLKPDTVVVDGDGSSDNPFELNIK